MSRFYGDLKGSRGNATRQGTKASGIEGHVRGWGTGARVTVEQADIQGQQRDLVKVYRTTGSNGRGNDELVACWFDDQQPHRGY